MASGSGDDLLVRLWGVRGSMPAPGARFEEFGGNTPCVEVRCGDRLVIIDAGTGLAALGSSLDSGSPAAIDIVLSHLHLDHVSGLPFFKPALMPDRLIRTHCGHLGGQSAAEGLGRLFSPPLFPVGLDVLPCTFEHRGFKAGEILRLPDGPDVRTAALNHPGGATGYRFDHRGRSACYVSDIEHTDAWPPAPLVDFVRGADLVIYDGMFSESEYVRCQGWGHSTWEKGVALCEAAAVGKLVVFHLHPQHDDAFMRDVEARLVARMPGAEVAREGSVFSFPPVA